MITPYLRQLIILSSLPLADVETVFAVDSSGFATSCFARWIDRRYGKASAGDKRIWLKVHLMCGVLTNIVTAVEVSSANAGDSPFFKRLVEATAKFFLIKEVLADKAYSSLENLKLVRKLKAMVYIPFGLMLNRFTEPKIHYGPGSTTSTLSMGSGLKSTTTNAAMSKLRFQ
jgi:hypothetical protein